MLMTTFTRVIRSLANGQPHFAVLNRHHFHCNFITDAQNIVDILNKLVRDFRDVDKPCLPVTNVNKGTEVRDSRNLAVNLCPNCY